jgi:hypothetical protein
VEWPSKLSHLINISIHLSLPRSGSNNLLASLFKEPKEPASKCKVLTLDSSDGKSLSVSKTGLSRRSTQGSVTTIGSLESATAAHNRLQERAGGKTIKSLVMEFYDANGTLTVIGWVVHRHLTTG